MKKYMLASTGEIQHLLERDKLSWWYVAHRRKTSKGWQHWTYANKVSHVDWDAISTSKQTLWKCKFLTKIDYLLEVL